MRRRISVSARCTQQSSSTTSFVRVIRSVTLVALSVLWITPPVAAVRKLQIAIPLQALTIWDPECQQEQQLAAGDEGTAAAAPTHRGRFLPRFRAGLQAEVATRQTILEQQQQQTAGVAVAPADTAAVSTVSNNKNWASRAKAIDMQRARVTEERVEQAHDQAVAQYDAQLQELLEQQMKTKNANQFQFVGVINSATGTTTADSKPPITWYARKKPTNARWSMRLVHVNREAILKDLYNRGKIDIFGRYENTQERDAKTGQPIVSAKYTVRERSWK